MGIWIYSLEKIRGRFRAPLNYCRLMVCNRKVSAALTHPRPLNFQFAFCSSIRLFAMESPAAAFARRGRIPRDKALVQLPAGNAYGLARYVFGVNVTRPSCTAASSTCAIRAARISGVVLKVIHYPPKKASRRPFGYKTVRNAYVGGHDRRREPLRVFREALVQYLLYVCGARKR